MSLRGLLLAASRCDQSEGVQAAQVGMGENACVASAISERASRIQAESRALVEVAVHAQESLNEIVEAGFTNPHVLHSPRGKPLAIHTLLGSRRAMRIERMQLPHGTSLNR